MLETEERLLEVVNKIRMKYPIYGRRAYLFIYEVVGCVSKKLSLLGQQVTAETLLVGFRELVTESFGPMALEVLQSWNVKNCEDVGRIVEHLVEFNVLRREASDAFEDFVRYQFDFQQAFGS